MKKRLLSIFLVAFVLCTLAINSFAIVDNNNLPMASNFATMGRTYPQRPEFSQTISVQPYFNAFCPTCGEIVTVVNYRLPDDIDTNYYDYIVVVGAYTTYEQKGWKNSFFQMFEVSPAFGHFLFDDANDGWLNSCYIGSIGTFSGSKYFYLHRDFGYVNVDNVPYFINIFDNTQSNLNANRVANQLNQHYNTIRTNVLRDRNTTTYFNRVRQWIYDYYLSTGLTVQDFMLSDNYDSYYDDGFDVGYDEGYLIGFQDGYESIDVKNIYNLGYLEGQDSSNWTFMELFDGLFAGFGEFVSPFMSIGINDITIGSFLGLIGSVYLVLLLLRIIRG